MTDIKADIAAEALKIVNGERRSTYGKPEQNFGRIATLQAAYMAVRETTDRKAEPLSPLDVAMLNILQKVARIAGSPGHRDSYVDIVGYALCAAEVVISPTDAHDAALVMTERYRAARAEHEATRPTIAKVKVGDWILPEGWASPAQVSRLSYENMSVGRVAVRTDQQEYFWLRAEHAFRIVDSPS